MMVVLHNKFCKLRNGVCPTVFHVRRDIRCFRPDDDATLVAQVIKIFAVLIMRKPYGVCADLANQVDIFSMMFGQERISYAEPVLMSGNASQGIGASVQNKTFIRIDFKCANS